MSFLQRLQTGLTNIYKMTADYYLTSFQMRQARRMGPYGMMALGGMSGLTGGSNMARSIFSGYGNSAASLYGGDMSMSNYLLSMSGASPYSYTNSYRDDIITLGKSLYIPQLTNLKSSVSTLTGGRDTAPGGDDTASGGDGNDTIS